ncbi:AEC family transporter [Escherichia coli]|uniref:AEC family transporter n=1 Tax=Escherichia coli TaxID=562 RepID=UPI002035FB83|nr:AEC family transporter [Escherichia coli]
MSNVINPGIVACILALLLYISNVHIPYIIAQPIKMLGAITGPVSMLLIGSFLLDIEWKSVFKDVKVWIFTFFKMVIIPLVIILIMLGLSIVRAVAIMHRGDFEPGARSAWHTHPAGQRLIVTSGVGLTQQEGKPVQVIRAGDVISCPADVKHWHGVAPGSAMTHLAITGMVDGKSVNWKELVADEQYHAH